MAKRTAIFWSQYLHCEAKMCSQCKLPRPLADFSKDKKATTGLNAICRRCASIRSKEWARRHPEAIKTKSQKYYSENKERIKAKRRRYVEANRQKASEERRRCYKKYKTEISKRLAKYSRTAEGRLKQNRCNIKKTYGVTFEMSSFIDAYIRDKEYLRLYRAWKVSGYELQLAPCADIPDGAERTISNIKWRTRKAGHEKSIANNTASRLRNRALRDLQALPTSPKLAERGVSLETNQ